MMTKKQLAWLIIRIIGVFLLYKSLNLAFVVFQNLMAATSLDNSNIVLEKGAGLFSGWIVEGIVYLLLGLYFVIDGKVLFNLLDRETESDEEDMIKLTNE